MTEIYRLLLTSSLAFLLANAALWPARAVAANCQDLPPSKLLVFGVKVPEVEEEEIPAASLDRKLATGALTFRHTMMLASTVLVGWFEIRHRPVPQPGGSVCDAPELVRMGFGAARRQIFLAEPAADDPCVRRMMLDHEADHARAFDDAVDRFINDRRFEFERGMKALKQTSAPGAKAAAKRWDEGLRLIVSEAQRQLMIELSAANAEVDAPAVLTSLRRACNGRIEELERRKGTSPNP
jgi:hypothetical protein